MPTGIGPGPTRKGNAIKWSPQKLMITSRHRGYPSGLGGYGCCSCCCLFLGGLPLSCWGRSASTTYLFGYCRNFEMDPLPDQVPSLEKSRFRQLAGGEFPLSDNPVFRELGRLIVGPTQ